jgi:hypothetical protein
VKALPEQVNSGKPCCQPLQHPTHQLNIRTIEMLVDRHAVTSGVVASDEP